MVLRIDEMNVETYSLGVAGFVATSTKRIWRVWFYHKSSAYFIKLFSLELFIDFMYYKNFFSVNPIFLDILLVNFLYLKFI
jgi:hypothetical protein